MDLKPIGSVKSSEKNQVDQNWGEVISEIHVDISLELGLMGLEEFSHALIVFICTKHQ
jgi:tRNA (Thr-GGU) A37 N-methylase